MTTETGLGQGVAVTEPPGLRDFVRAHERALLRFGWALTGDWPAAEDLVQTALAQAWPRWHHLDHSEAYVRRIMVTTFLRWRSRRWTREIPSEELPTTPAGDVYATADLRHTLIAGLDRLAPRQRVVIVLRYFADLSETDTAAAMGCSVGAVKSQTAAALDRLRSQPQLANLLTGEL